MKKLDQYRERIFSASITEIVLLMLFMILAVATLYKADRDKYKGAIEDVLGNSIVAHIDTLDIDSLSTSKVLQEIKDQYELSEDQEELFEEIQDLKDSLNTEKGKKDSLEQELLLMASTDLDSVLSENEELKEDLERYKFQDILGENPPICGLQNDISKRLVNSNNTAIFKIYFSKTSKNQYILEFDPDSIHTSNKKLLKKTPQISRQFFALPYSKKKTNSYGKGSGDYHLNFSEVHSFLGQIKDSRRINLTEPECNQPKYMNKAYCLECYYNSELWIRANISKEELIEVQRILRVYLNVESNVRTF